MRYIPKGTEPDSFSAWKGLENEDWKPEYKLLRNPQKADLHASLIREQRQLCCYCETRISQENSHIEHVIPQSLRPDLALDYSNLLCSCGRPVKSKDMPSHCGNHKAAELLPITPLQSDCEAHFIFMLDGTIKGAENDEAAEQTIAILNLDARELRESRAAAIDSFSEILELESDWQTAVQRFLASDPVEYVSWLEAFLSSSPLSGATPA